MKMVLTGLVVGTALSVSWVFLNQDTSQVGAPERKLNEQQVKRILDKAINSNKKPVQVMRFNRKASDETRSIRQFYGFPIEDNIRIDIIDSGTEDKPEWSYKIRKVKLPVAYST